MLDLIKSTSAYFTNSSACITSMNTIPFIKNIMMLTKFSSQNNNKDELQKRLQSSTNLNATLLKIFIIAAIKFALLINNLIILIDP